ncbi:MAG: hypothetical protein J1D86_01870 [Alistipes sp.]|nr:hypothetical protein [Alistipes sp.]
MYEFTTPVYQRLAAKLRDGMGRDNYFSGSVSMCDGDVEIRFIASLIILRGHDDSGGAGPVRAVEPVWWECHTTQGRDEMLNDCDFSFIRKLVCDE